MRTDVIRECHDYPIVAIEYLSKWLEAEAVPTTSAAPVIGFLEKIVFRHGSPHFLVSDRVPAFGSKEFAEFLDKWKIKHAMASADHPQTNGWVEKINRALAETLAAFVNVAHTNWDEKLSQAIFAINTTKQSTTLFSSYKLVYGRRPHLPLDYLFPLTDQSDEREENYFRRISHWR